MIRRFVWILAIALIPACGLMLEEGRKVVAEIGGEPIRVEDLTRRIRGLPFEERAWTNAANEAARIEARRRVLENLIVEKLMLLEAESRGETVSDEEIEEIITREREKQNAARGLLQEMRDGGHSHENGGEEYTRQEIGKIRERIMVEKLTEKEFSDAALREIYKNNIQNFILESPLVNYEMVVAAPANAEFIDTLHKKAAEKGGALIYVYNAFADPPDTLFAGVTPTIPINTIVPSMRKHVENLRLGEISEPFLFRQNQTDQYAIAKLVRYIDKNPFKNVKKDLRLKVHQEFIDRLKEKYQVTYHYDKLNYKVGG